MIQRDYLMRMIQEFIKMMSVLLESKQVGNLKDIEKNLDLAAKIILGMDRKAVCRIEPSELKQELIRSGSTHEFIAKAQVMSRILTESAELADREGRNDESRDLYLKALNLLLETIIGGEPVELLEFTPRIEGIVDCLSSLILPSETLIGLMQYYEKQGEYAKAEDQLFQLCEASAGGEGLSFLSLLGEGFYKRLSALPDSIVSGGGLPRDEVEFGRDEFRKRVTFREP